MKAGQGGEGLAMPGLPGLHRARAFPPDEMETNTSDRTSPDTSAGTLPAMGTGHRGQVSGPAPGGPDGGGCRGVWGGQSSLSQEGSTERTCGRQREGSSTCSQFLV